METVKRDSQKTQLIDPIDEDSPWRQSTEPVDGGKTPVATEEKLIKFVSAFESLDAASTFVIAAIHCTVNRRDIATSLSPHLPN